MNETTIIVSAYLIYLLISINLTIWVRAHCKSAARSSWWTLFTATPSWQLPSTSCW